MKSNDPSQVLDVMRDVLLEHMKDGLPCYRIERAILIGASGRLIGQDQIIAGNDVPRGLRLTMQDGQEYDLTLGPVHDEASPTTEDA